MVGVLTTKDCVTLASVARGLTLEEALLLLNRISRLYQHKTIFLYALATPKLDFRDLADNPTNCYRLLRYLPPIWFRGGPGRKMWFRGTPLTFVMDCLLDATVLYGEEFVAEHIYDYYTSGAP